MRAHVSSAMKADQQPWLSRAGFGWGERLRRPPEEVSQVSGLARREQAQPPDHEVVTDDYDVAQKMPLWRDASAALTTSFRAWADHPTFMRPIFTNAMALPAFCP
jgi:hypothetical protein